VRRRPVALALAAVAALALPLAAAAGNGGFAPPDPASPGAERIRDVYWLISAFAGAVFLLVAVPLVVFIVRFRSRGRDRDVEGPQIRGNTSLELAWVVIPVLILFVVGGYVFYKLPGIVDPSPAEASVELRVRVEGRQFYWQYEYPNGVVTISELRLPVDRTAELEMIAPDGDVIHSYWVPELAGKRDVVPGEVTTMRVLPRRVGTFEVVCGEFCGIQHAAMLGSVEVVAQQEFDNWLREEQERQVAGTSDLGGSIWTNACAVCHGPEVAGKVGPPLEDNPLLADRDGLEQVVRNGRGAMPAVGQGWSDRQFDALFEFTRMAIAGETGEEDEGGEGGG
jgi:cytochrome c oxidase subunit 2